MDKLIESAPNIIQEAAKSPLGLFALMILTLSVLGFFFFRNASEWTRTTMFVLIFIGVASFGFATVRTMSGIVSPPESMRSDIQRGSQVSGKPPGGGKTIPISKTKTEGKLGDELFTPQWGLQVHNIDTPAVYVDRYVQEKSTYHPLGADDILLVIDARVKNHLQKPQQPILDRRRPGNSGLIDSEDHSYPPLHYDARRGDFGRVVPLLPGTVADFAMIFSVPKGTKLKSLVISLNDEMDDLYDIRGTDFQISLPR